MHKGVKVYFTRTMGKFGEFVDGEKYVGARKGEID